MTAHLAEAANSLNALPTGVELVVLIASDDGGDLLTPVQMVTPELLSALTDRIRAAQCEGERSNVAALLRAWDLAVASDCGMVVWVHGPIRELTDAPEPFLDRWREGSVKPRFLDVQTEAGPNRLLERLGAAEGFDSVTRRWSLSQDLRRVFSVSKQTSVETKLVRGSGANERSDAYSAKGPTAWAMARLWANDRISSLLRAETPDHNAALKLAKKYHLVSPITGAVVLEADEQYIRAGLGGAPPMEVAPAGSRENVSFPSDFPLTHRGSNQAFAVAPASRKTGAGGPLVSRPFSTPLVPQKMIASRRDNQSPAPKGPGAAGLASGSGEIGFDLRSSWYQSGTPYDGLILFPVTLFLFARLLLGGPMIRIPFEDTKR